ncbi:DUF2993 domain-containing protein [Lusitaniella coriacea LEGE 07157]|uniref:DUF2993 domain-containing protein n=1 Tax=Lusitaniella coriacea LEGE 07157 TaxID=945747 RepID=A0A8J7DLG1_9CYAN|nr:DUF2993 domain-containing protein [Lusitaniella coriacea]MBE9114998.1 DUF2993 domain-containing protein [Lusitaniella coriacea LEGE 07157]
MEIFIILLSGLLGGLAPSGFIVDSVAQGAIRSNLQAADVVAVRVDNTPSYQLIGGKADRVRIALRGVQPTPLLRIDTLELETDPIDVDLEQLRQGGREALAAFRQPFQGGVRLVLTEEDLNQALQSPAFAARSRGILQRIAGNFSSDPNAQFQLIDPKIDLLEGNRLRLDTQVRSMGLTATDLEQFLTPLPQRTLNQLQQSLQTPNNPQTLQTQIAQFQQLKLESLQTLLLELQQLDLPPEQQPLTQPLPPLDFPTLQTRLSALQQSLQKPDSPQKQEEIRQRAVELQPSLAEAEQFLIAVQKINPDNAEPFLSEPQQFSLSLESGIAVDSGSNVQLVDPQISVDGEPIPPFFLQGITGGIGDALDLRRLETSGVTLRLLQLEIDDREMEAAIFVRLVPPTNSAQ